MYVITKKNTYEVDNKVYFADTLDNALATVETLEVSSEDWIIAVVLP